MCPSPYLSNDPLMTSHVNYSPFLLFLKTFEANIKHHITSFNP